MKPDPVAWHGLPGKAFAYSAPLRAHTPLEMKVSIPPNRIQTSYACHIWEASLLLSDAISSGEVGVKDMVVLELGAGAGLAGLVACRKGAEKVVLSEYDDDSMLDDLRKNVVQGLTDEQQDKVAIVGHSWGDTPSLNTLANHGPFDLILLADTVYQPQSHPALLSTLAALTTEQTEIAFYAGFHSGRHVVRSFLARAKQAGIVPLAPEAWQEVTDEGAVSRKWVWEAEIEEEDKESHEQKARWTVVGRLVKAGRQG